MQKYPPPTTEELGEKATGYYAAVTTIVRLTGALHESGVTVEGIDVEELHKELTRQHADLTSHIVVGSIIMATKPTAQLPETSGILDEFGRSAYGRAQNTAEQQILGLLSNPPVPQEIPVK